MTRAYLVSGCVFGDVSFRFDVDVSAAIAFLQLVAQNGGPRLPGASGAFPSKAITGVVSLTTYLFSQQVLNPLTLSRPSRHGRWTKARESRFMGPIPAKYGTKSTAPI
jgi:hypothetical protein